MDMLFGISVQNSKLPRIVWNLKERFFHQKFTCRGLGDKTYTTTCKKLTPFWRKQIK
jgi:hypothetical protein